MKLFKKLIPLAAIGAATSVVVPLATSCSTVGVYTQKVEDLYFGKFIRETEVISGGTMSKDVAALRYTQDIEKNNMILVDDYFQNIQDILSIVANNEKNEECPVKGSLSIKVMDIQPYYHRLSLHLCIHASIPSEYLGDFDKNQFDNLELEVDINNFHYEMNHFKPTGSWEYAPVYYGEFYRLDSEALEEDHNWSMKAKGSFDMILYGSHIKVNVDQLYDFRTDVKASSARQIFTILGPFLVIYSNYLDNVIEG